jgi:hypothetical protein
MDDRDVLRVLAAATLLSSRASGLDPFSREMVAALRTADNLIKFVEQTPFK